MLHCGNYMPVPLAHTTVGYSVTFPVLPYQNADITEFNDLQKSFCNYSGIASEATCEKCRLEKKESLNRQLYELVKKHGLVEVAGQEILGWYMLLAAEDRKLIKEYGHISEYIKDNHPSLSIVNNWVQLKKLCLLKSGESTKILENSQSLEDNSSNRYTQTSCDSMLRRSGHADVNHVTKVNPQRDTLWFDVANDFKKEDLDPGKKSLGACRFWDTSTVGEPEITFDSEDIKYCPTPVLPLDAPNNQETSQDLAYVKPCLPSLTKEPFTQKQFVGDCKAVSKVSSECEMSCSMKLKTGKNLKEYESAVSKGFEDSEVNDRNIIKSKDSCFTFEGSKRVVSQDERNGILPWLKCSSDVDDDCSSVDILDDETFFSVKSGSFYSRSSSPFSLDDSTDIEQCAFEEALEDLSSLSLYGQAHNSQIVPYGGDQSVILGPPSDMKNVQRANNAPLSFAVHGETKPGNVSCHTDFSWVSRSSNDKETQTKKLCTQDTGVNTDPIESGLFSQTLAAVLKEVEIAKDVEESKGTRESASSPPLEALLQRAVKAELQLVDVQRWLCWQMCWKTQQQTIEKQSFFNLDKEPSQQSTSMTTFSLSSALAEVEEKYQEMRAKIQSGTPLDTLVPLTMQLTTVESPTPNLLRDTSQHNKMQNVSDVPAEPLKETKCMKNDIKASFMSSLDNCEQKRNEMQPTEHLSETSSHYYVHVGNIAPCIKEVELMDAFWKYNIYNVFLEESSLTCSYAVLIFLKSENAEAAIREMDGKILYGKKIKVRAIKTSNYNLPLAFQSIKSLSRDFPEDEKGRFPTAMSKEGVVSEPPKSDATQPSQGQHDHTQAASDGGSLKNAFSNMLGNKCYPHINTNQGIPVASPCSTSGFSNLMAPGYQWMMQSNHSNMIYSNMPNLMYVPFSYPLYKLPHHPPFQSSLPIPNNCMPGINMKSNVNSQFGKNECSPVRAKPRKSIHNLDRKTSSGIARSIVHNQVTSSTDKAKIWERNTAAKFMEDKHATVKSVSEPTSFFTTSSNAKPSETASPVDSLKMSVSVTKASVCGEESTVTDYWSSCDEQKHISGSLSAKSAAPLRSPTFVPRSVTIPEVTKISANPILGTGVSTHSAKQAQVKSSDTTQQETSFSAGKTDWGVFPQIDTSSELPIIIIPNQLNFSQFKKVVKHLTELHKDATRDQVIGTLEEIRRNRGGTLGGLTIPEILFAASSKLAGNIPPA
ncbi:RNA-binding protein 44 [Rhinoderma darwinii]|uniref:RNA-binding protein 44 n=1 Tax=Rhinoderma darwinii TaxID=43563 RepID=UPI003F6653C5